MPHGFSFQFVILICHLWTFIDFILDFGFDQFAINSKNNNFRSDKKYCLYELFVVQYFQFSWSTSKAHKSSLILIQKCSVVWFYWREFKSIQNSIHFNISKLNCFQYSIWIFFGKKYMNYEYISFWLNNWNKTCKYYYVHINLDPFRISLRTFGSNNFWCNS